MSRPNLLLAVLFAAGAVVTGVLVTIGVAAGRPDFLTAVLFVVLAAGAVDGFTRRPGAVRYSGAYLLAFAAFGAATAIALLAAGSVVGGAVLLTIAAGAVVLHVVESRRRRTAGRPDGDPPTGA